LKGYSTPVTETILKAKRASSLKLYESYTGRWIKFCRQHSVPPIYASVAQGLSFLQTLVDEGLGYSVLNTARSALSAVIVLPTGISFGSNNDVKLFMKGVFNLKPTVPKYVSTWDPSKVLCFLETWTPASELSFDKLTMKLLVLILLVTGQRPQVLSGLDLLNMKKGPTSFEFALHLTDLKQGRANYRPLSILLKHYPANKRLCVFHYLSTYIQRTALLCKDHTKLILTTRKPFRPASKNSISRWVKELLTLAGIDTTVFSAGSVRSAATSKAKSQGAPIDQILSMGGWSNSSTFTKFYDRPVLDTDFATRVLQS
jgi:integrase